MMEQVEISLDQYSDVAEDKKVVLRLFNILSNLQNDAERYCKTFEELHRSGTIDDFQYELIAEGLSSFSLGCRELAMRIDSIKEIIEDSSIENPS